MQDFYSQLDQYLINNALEAPPLGCTEEEIIQQENIYTIHFPLAYRLFLKWCGNSHMHWMNGQNFGPGTLSYSWESATELLAENQSTLESNGFVFSEWQGYNFWYFLQGSKNPAVKLCIIRSKVDPGLEFIEYGCFTDWLISRIKDSVKLWHSLRGYGTNVHVPTIWAELDRIAQLANI